MIAKTRITVVTIRVCRVLRLILTSFVFAFFVTKASLSNQSFYSEHQRGWHWYEKKQKEEEKQPQDSSPNANSLSPTEQVEEIRRDAKAKLHRAMINPSEANVIAYIKAQEKIGDSSEKFSEMWKRVVFKYPDLDRTIKNPVSFNALHISRQDELQSKRQKIRNLSNEYGLMYFYRGDCKYCQGFASVVKSFSKKYNWDVMPIQIGDVPSAEFPNAKQNNGIAEKLGISTVPALIAVHPKSQNLIPLAFGYLDEASIEDRVDILTGGLKQ